MDLCITLLHILDLAIIEVLPTLVYNMVNEWTLPAIHTRTFKSFDDSYRCLIDTESINVICYASKADNLWLALRKPSMFACKFWPYFRTLNLHSFHMIKFNIIKNFKNSKEIPKLSFDTKKSKIGWTIRTLQLFL